jgi:Divergent InlB B-repeat domain
MSSPGGGYTVGWVRTKWAALAAIAIVAVLLPTPGLLGHASAVSAAPAPARLSPAAHLVAPVHAGVRAAASPTVTGNFFQNASSFSQPSIANEACTPYYTESYCDPQAQSPSLLNLSNGNLGIAFSQITSYNTSTCTYPSVNLTGGSINVSVWTYIRVLFEASGNFGASFGSPTYVNESCPYAQQFEPSYAMAPSGTIDGAFVQANATPTALNFYPFEPPLAYYYPRYHDALAFVNSTNNGATFSNATTIVTGNVSRPAIATFGKTVYIVYENVSAGNTSIASGYPSSQYPTSINLVYSSDQGATWHGPYTLPGENVTFYNTSYSPSITVTASGTVAVAYDTNRSCIHGCGGPYQEFGEDIVVATSTTNGTTWNGPYTVRSGIGEPSYFSSSYTTGNYRPFIFEYAPSTSIVTDPLSGNLYVAWDGAYNSNATYVYYDFTQSVVWAGVSSNGGLTWFSSRISGPEVLRATPFEGGYFTPALAMHFGTVYLTYTEFNYTSATCGYATYLAYSYSQWLTTSLNGVTWAPSGPITISPQTYGGNDFLGYTSSLAFSSTGSPIAAYPLPKQASYTFPIITYPSVVQVASAWTGATIPVTVHESGLVPGTSWTFDAGVNVYTLTTNNTTITDFPSGQPVFMTWTGSPTFTSYGEYQAALNPQQMVNFGAPTNFTFVFTRFVAFTASVQPPDIQSFTLELYNSSGHSFNFYAQWYTQGYAGIVTSYFYGCPFPWYLPLGLHLDFTPVAVGPIYSYYFTGAPISYWNGTGLGNFTGVGPDANITLNGPVNETAWALPVGYYNVSFGAVGLPPASVFSFNVDGLPYSAPATQTVAVHQLATGPHWISNISANSTQPGWVYIGRSNAGNPLLVPDQPSDNFSFAYENVSAPTGIVSFHANGFTAGTVWRFEFNGTIYSSSTPWINITTHPGNFTQTAFPVTSANGSVGYTPVALPAVTSVTPGSTYLVNYTSAYQLQIIAGFGGRVAPATTSYWLVPGSMKSFTATPNVGYTWGGWTGSGLGSYTGFNLTANVTVNGPVIETAAFVPLPGARFNLTVQETGIPNGTMWSAYIGGVGYSSSNWQINVSQVYSCTVSGPRGQYALGLPYEYANGTPALTRYVPVAPPPTVCGDAVTTLRFAPQYFLTLQTTAGGTISAVFGSSVLTNGSWVPGAALVSLSATANPGYLFLGWNGTGLGNYTGPQGQPQVQMFGPVSELAAFAPIIVPPPPRFVWSFVATPAFPSGTTWTVDLNGVNYSSDTSTLNVSGLLAGTYTLTVGTVASADGLTEWRAAAPAPLHLAGNGSSQVAFSPYYWFSIRAVGPGSVTPATGGWYAGGQAVTIIAAATPPDLFLGWVGTGVGSYTGTLNSTPLHINAPISEVATFGPPAPAVKTVSSAFTSTGLLVGLAIVGLVVGLVVGLLAARMRRGREGPPPMTPATPYEPVGPAPPGPSAAAPGDYMEDEHSVEASPMGDDTMGGGPA